MRKTFIGLLLLCLTANLLAQKSPAKTIKRDTINLRGYVYNDKGKPVRFLFMESAQNEFIYNEFKASARTDTNGYFEIKGAKLNDTIKIGDTNLYGSPVYYNKDSRYMVIYLPAANVLDVNSTDPIQVIQKRKYPKVIPEFKLEVRESGDFFPDVSQPPRYQFGNDAFLKIIGKWIAYPETAVKSNTEGTVEIGFTVERDGSLVNLKILKGIGSGCDEAVLKALKKAPRWKPGFDHWMPIAMKATISVQFKLSDK